MSPIVRLPRPSLLQHFDTVFYFSHELNDRANRNAYRPFSVYSTWGFHDKLSDTVDLTEELALRALDRTERWQREYRFDGFHIDCFRLERSEPFTLFERRRRDATAAVKRHGFPTR